MKKLMTRKPAATSTKTDNQVADNNSTAQKPLPATSTSTSTSTTSSKVLNNTQINEEDAIQSIYIIDISVDWFFRSFERDPKKVWQ